MRKIDETKTRFYFAADTDVLINLSKLAAGNSEELKKEAYIVDKYKALWEMVYNGDVKLYVTPQVLSELGNKITQYTSYMASRNDVAVFIDMAKFVRAFCYPIYIEHENIIAFQEKAKHLAERYCVEAGVDGIISEGVDGTQYVIPSKDAKVLAEASVCGLTLLTSNTIDMIINSKNKRATIQKVDIIEKINMEEGLGYGDRCLWNKAPAPMSVIDFLKHLPNCYMDQPFLPDTNFAVKDLDPLEVDKEYRESYNRYYKFMFFIENTTKDTVEAIGIEKPYEYIINGVRYKEDTLNNDDGKQDE